MKKYLLRSLIILTTLAFVSIGVAWAHGAAVIAVQPDVVAAGGEITVTGTEMESGETFVITLEGATSSITLGTATATPNEAEVTLRWRPHLKLSHRPRWKAKPQQAAKLRRAVFV